MFPGAGLDPIQQSNRVLASQGWVDSTLASPGYPNPMMLPLPQGVLYPKRESYGTEEMWLKAMAQYIVAIVRPTWMRRLAQHRLAFDLYTQVTDFSQVPSYGRDPENLAQLPAERYFLNALVPIINTKQGEFTSKEYKIGVYVTNEEAKSRKADFLQAALADKFFADISPDAFKSLGIDPQLGGDPENPIIIRAMEEYEGSVREFVETKYRDVYADLMERVLFDWMERNNIDSWLSQAYKFYLLTGAACAQPYIDERTSEVVLPLVKPEDFVPDTRARDNFFDTGNFFIRFSWQTLESVQMRYPNLTVDELKKFIGARQNMFGINVWRADSDGRYYVIVMHLQFKQPKVMEYDLEVPVSERLEMREMDERVEIDVQRQVEKKKYKEAYEELYYADLIGGMLFAEGGVVKNQIRSAADPAKAHLNAEMLIYDYSISPQIGNNTLRLAVLIHQRNYVLQKLMRIISSIEPAKMELDVRLIPAFDEAAGTEENFRIWWEQFKNNNVILVDRSNLSLNPGADASAEAVRVKNISEKDIQVVGALTEMINYIDQQIQQYMGFSPARTGKISQYSTSSNVQQELTQSDYATADERIAFEKWFERVLQKVANLQKVAIVGLIEASRAGDQVATEKLDLMRIRYGDEIMTYADGFIFQDYGIKVKRRANADQQLQELRQLAAQALQQGADLDMLAVNVDLVTSDSVSEVQRKLVDLIRYKKSREEAAMQQQMLAQQAAQQATVEAQTGAQYAAADSRNRATIEKELIKQDAETQRELMRQQQPV